MVISLEEWLAQQELFDPQRERMFPLSRRGFFTGDLQYELYSYAELRISGGELQKS